MLIDYRAIGGKLREIRESKGLTQENISNKTGISMVHIGNIENGRKKFGLEVLLLYCDALEVTIDYILGVSNAIIDDDTVNKFRCLLINCDDREKEKLYRMLSAYIEE